MKLHRAVLLDVARLLLKHRRGHNPAECCDALSADLVNQIKQLLVIGVGRLYRIEEGIEVVP